MDPTTYQKLDRVIHERGRLGIMSLLATAEARTFKEMRDLLGMTDGNLSVHMRTLEESGYVSVTKDFVDRKPRSTYALTETGRRAFGEYIAALEEIVEQSRVRDPEAAPAGRGRETGATPALASVVQRRRRPTPAAE